MSNGQTALERALPIVATAYGEQFGVNVVLSGNDACTDGQTIVLPMLDEKSGLKDVLLGYLAHEAAHIRDTDFGLLTQCKGPIEKSFLNLIEDIRIEKLIQEVFPGIQFTLGAMENYIFEKGWTSAPSVDENEATQLMKYLYHRMYEQVLDRECYSGMTLKSEKVVEQTFPQGFFIRLDGIFAKYMFSLTSTQDCLKIARAILKALDDAEIEERQQEEVANQNQTDGEGSNESSSNVCGNSSDDDRDLDSEQAEPTQTNSENEQEEVSDGSNSKSAQSDLAAGGEAKDGDKQTLHEKLINETDLPDDVSNLLKGQFKRQAKKDNGGERFQIDTFDIGEVVKNNSDLSGLQTGILASSVIRARLLGLLQAQTREKQWLHTRGKRVKGNRLNRLAQGDSRVFIQRENLKQIDTAVHVLLDTSGSMHACQDVANQATVSLALAVQSIAKSDIAVSMFPGIEGAVSPMVLRNQGVRANLGRLNVSSGGGTPLAEAMLFAARELALSRRTRKVLIVITDGDPNCGSSVNYLNKLIKGHIDTYAIGINSTAVSQYFEKWVSISDVKQLQKALFDIAGQFFELN